jgi:hypothetical protein
MNQIRLIFITVVAILVAVTATACQTGVGQQQPAQPPKTAVSVTTSGVVGQTSPTQTSKAGVASTPTVKYVGQFSVSPIHAPIGSTVNAMGSGFAANTELELVWQGFIGTWKIGDGTYNGRDFSEVMQTLNKVKTDANGSFQTTFVVPQGFGFEHDVVVENGNVIQNKSNFNVDMQVAFSPSSGPVGAPINIDAQGIGWRSLENSWTVIYDNRFVGFISSVTTNGTAHAFIPAVGAPGKHVIQIIHGSQTFPYMNMQQSPQPDRPSWKFEFTVTDGPAVQPPAAQDQSLPVQMTSGKPNSFGPALWTDVASGIVGTPLNIQGSGLPAGKQLDLQWFRVVGSRVSGNGWQEASVSLGKVTVGDNGTIAFPIKALDDLGGPHRIEAQLDGVKLAETSFTITPSAFALTPSSGPVGTTITVHLKGVGWTETANIYTVVYDNAYVGYACGFNSQGDITVYLPATGEPGCHYIDLYPGIYKGNEISGTNNFRIPQLTAENDHPGEKLPVFHFAFIVSN